MILLGSSHLADHHDFPSTFRNLISRKNYKRFNKITIQGFSGQKLDDKIIEIIHHQVKQSTESFRYTSVYLQLGSNDLRSPKSNVKEVTQLFTNVIHEITKTYACNFIVPEVIPFPRNDASSRIRYQQFNANMKQLSMSIPNMHIMKLSHVFTRKTDDNKHLPNAKYFKKDRLHLNQLGMQQLSQRIFRYLCSLPNPQ